MNVASRELSEQLFKLSGWKDTEHSYTDKQISKDTKGTQDDPHIMGVIPAYDLGYLLRKLPIELENRDEINWLNLHVEDEGQWEAGYNSRANVLENAYGHTPEDAAARLAIELFKQKVLTKDAA